MPIRKGDTATIARPSGPNDITSATKHRLQTPHNWLLQQLGETKGRMILAKASSGCSPYSAAAAPMVGTIKENLRTTAAGGTRRTAAAEGASYDPSRGTRPAAAETMTVAVGGAAAAAVVVAVEEITPGLAVATAALAGQTAAALVRVPQTCATPSAKV